MSDRIPKPAEAAAPAERTGRDLKQVNARLRELIHSLKTDQERHADARSALACSIASRARASSAVSRFFSRSTAPSAGAIGGAWTGTGVGA